MIGIVDLEFSLSEMNPRWAELLGFSISQLLHSNFLDLFNLKDRESLKEALLSKKSEFIAELSIRKSDGMWLPVKLRLVWSAEENNFIVVMHNLEPLKMSERRLRDSQALAEIGSWEWDITTNSIFWSEQQYRLFGRTRDLRWIMMFI